MSDTIEARNHRKPCEHGWFVFHDSLATGDCPGGKKVVLRRVEGAHIGRRVFFEFYHHANQGLPDHVWREVEVPNE